MAGGGAVQKKRKYNGTANNGQQTSLESPKSSSASSASCSSSSAPLPSNSSSASSSGAVINIKQEPLSSLDNVQNIVQGRRARAGTVPSPEPPCIQSMRPSCEDDFGFDYPNNGGGDNGTGSVYLDSAYQCIKFEEFLEQTWHTLYDENLKEM